MISIRSILKGRVVAPVHLGTKTGYGHDTCCKMVDDTSMTHPRQDRWDACADDNDRSPENGLMTTEWVDRVHVVCTC